MLTNTLIVLALILANGIFAMSELAIVSARKVRLQQAALRGDRRAQAALQLANRPNDFFSTVQVGITLISIISGAFGGAALSEPIATFFKTIPLLRPYAGNLAFGLVVVAITYLSLIIGELVPKQLALTMPEAIAKTIAGPMQTLSRLASPIVGLLSLSTKAVMGLLQIEPSNEPSVTEEEIRAFIRQGTEEGTFEEEEQAIMERVFRLGDRKVSSIMTPRPDVIWLDLEDSSQENQQKIAHCKHRRLPVCQGDLDDILGLVSVNDLLNNALAQQAFDLTRELEQPLVVPETMRSLKVLERFKQSRIHTALVIDEYGVIQGLVTLGDILEALVGDVPSWDTPEELEAQQREDGSWLIDGMMDIEAVQDLLKLEEPENRGSYHTLGGFVIHCLGKIPRAADRFEYAGWTFEVMDMDGNRVDKVLATPQPSSPLLPS